MKYSLRSLMVVILVLPPILAGGFAMAKRLAAEPERLRSSMCVDDDIQYFAPGPEFKLSREAASMRARKEEDKRAKEAFCPLVP